MGKPAKNALLEKIQSGSAQTIAKEAKVAPSLVHALIRDGFPKSEEDIQYSKEQLQDWSKRKASGFISSLVKLSVWADIKPEEIVLSYPFPWNKQVVCGWVADIHNRLYPGTSTNILADKKIANLPFPPFHIPRPDGLEWGQRFSQHLLVGIEPQWESEFIQTDFDEDSIIQRLTEPSGTNKLDLLFGFFRSPKRVAHNIGFVDIPGIRIKLGLLSNVPVTWQDIELSASSGANPFEFITIRGDVSESYLKRIVAPHKTIHTITVSDSSWETLAFAIKNKLDLISARGTQSKVCFICTANIISNVEQHLCEILPEGNLKLTNHRLPQNFNTEHAAEYVQELSEYVPSYQACIAINPHSTNLTVDASQYSIINSLFVNGIYYTASEYITLLLRDYQANGFFSIKFEKSSAFITSALWRKFLETSLHVVKMKIESLSKGTNDFVNEDATAVEFELVKTLIEYELSMYQSPSYSTDLE